MTSETAICNMALLQLGGERITSLDDSSREAKLCQTFYETTRDAVLESGAWTFATDRAILVPDATPPSWGYANRFLLPSECLLVREVHDTSQDPAPTIDDWEVENGYLLIDVATVWIRYTLRVTDRKSVV